MAFTVMNIWILLLLTVLILLLVVLLLAYAAEKEQKRIARQTESLLNAIDNKYHEYIQKHLDLAVLQEESPDNTIERISLKAYTVIKPEVDSIIATVDSTPYSNIPVRHSTRYFNSAASLVSAYFRKTAATPSAPLCYEDEQRIMQAFQDSIKADLTRRHLDLRASNFLD